MVSRAWKGIPVKLRVCSLLFVLCGACAGAFVWSGQAVVAVALLPSVPFLAWLFLGRRAALLWWGIGMVVLLVCGALALSGQRVSPPGQVLDTERLGWWVAGSAAYAICALVLVLPADYVLRRMTRALHDSGQLAGALRSERDGLRLQLAERTMDLELRAQYLEAITEVTHSVSTIIDDPQELLSQVVDLVSERFAFHHAGVFLLDGDRAWIELTAASSEEGQRMLRQGCHLPVGGRETVAQVASSGVPRIASDVASQGVPHLPDTQSEIALPLRVRGETIGVLDVQSTEVAAFSDDDVTVLQILADQVAIALSNARLFGQLQDSIEAMRRAYGEMGLEAWRGLLQSQGGATVRYDPHKAFSRGDSLAFAHGAQREGESARRKGGKGAPAALPIRVRGGHLIGTVQALKSEGAGAWTPDELGVLTSLVDQLGVALDGAQLYQESQQRAERERLVAEISARMRETLSVNAVLQTAIREIGDVLGLAEVEVRMRGEPEAER
ncbi:MAG: GAF domain-containing protein [Anaerolineae bacterium]|jgi:GAF domain-containing protein